MSAIKEAANLGLLITIFIFINALIGKHLLKGQLKDEDGEIYRLNF
jgi:hypothetical protein